MTREDDSGEPGASPDEPYETEDAGRRYEELARLGTLFGAEETVFDEHFTRPGARVLDLGCGAGRTTRELAERGMDVTGVDISEEMIERGRALFEQLDLRVGDATDLAFDDETFDYAFFSWGGLDLIEPETHRFRALREVRRVLKRRGTFAYCFHNALYTLPALMFDHDHVRNLYLANGNFGRIGSKYKISGTEFGAKYYVSTPFRQFLQLQRAGFDVVDFVGKRDSPAAYFELFPFVVAEKR